MLESYLHEFNSFLTLTYEDDFLPKNGSLSPRDLTLFVKRLRKAIYPKKVRVYSVGEYGELNERPHYHIALFGFDCLTPYYKLNKRHECDCANCNLIRRCWSVQGQLIGRIQIDRLEPKSAMYLCGYVTKKLTNSKNEQVKKWLRGRHPEFARPPRRPGLAAGAMEVINDQYLTTDLGARELLIQGDVPHQLKQGKKEFPLGRYLMRKLREFYGFKEIGAPKEKIKEKELQMCEVLEEIINTSKDAKERDVRIKNFYINEQKILNKESRYNLFEKKKGHL